MQFPQLQNVHLEIAGHTDARGSEQSNQLLSQRRAAAAVDLLTQVYSIEPDRLTAVGFGEAQLADPANPDSGKNRRVSAANSLRLGCGSARHVTALAAEMGQPRGVVDRGGVDRA